LKGGEKGLPSYEGCPVQPAPAVPMKLAFYPKATPVCLKNVPEDVAFPGTVPFPLKADENPVSCLM